MCCTLWCWANNLNSTLYSLISPCHYSSFSSLLLFCTPDPTQLPKLWVGSPWPRPSPSLTPPHPPSPTKALMLPSKFFSKLLPPLCLHYLSSLDKCSCALSSSSFQFFFHKTAKIIYLNIILIMSSNPYNLSLTIRSLVNQTNLVYSYDGHCLPTCPGPSLIFQAS